MIVTRFAPSPTGLLHLGHAYAAITAYESGDDFLLRIEDIDKGRSRDHFILAIFYDLKWLGLSWDEPTMRQSTRMGAYAEALVNLKARGLVYPCFCTRAEIAAEIARASEAQHFDNQGASGTGPEGPLYPGTCRHLSHEEGLARMAAGESYALRLDVTKAAKLAGPLSFTERGLRHAVDPLRFGDIVIARKDMPTSYHLAVVVDDAYQQVSLVTRGEDLLAAVAAVHATHAPCEGGVVASRPIHTFSPPPTLPSASVTNVTLAQALAHALDPGFALGRYHFGV